MNIHSLATNVPNTKNFIKSNISKILFLFLGPLKTPTSNKCDKMRKPTPHLILQKIGKNYFSLLQIYRLYEKASFQKNLNSHLRLLQVTFNFFDRPEQQMVMPTTQEGLHSWLPHSLMQGTKSQTFSRQAKLDEKIN